MLSIFGVPIPLTKFPDKTSQVWKLPPEISSLKYARIQWDFEDEGEIIHLAQAVDLLRSGGAVIDLHLPFLPYGRQDKEISNSTTFALRTFAKFVNQLGFEKITCLDPHSEIARECLRNFYALYAVDEVHFTFANSKSDLVCYPDAGALKKYTEIYKLPYVFGSKVRDQLTGNIVNYDLHGTVQDKNVLIVDDICDGGMTFILLAKALKSAGAKDIGLFVSHGIFSKGLDVLRDAGIQNIFTARKGKV